MTNNGGAAGADSKSHHEEEIEIWLPNPDRLKSMHQKVTTPPKLLSPTAGHSSCCIFRAPTTFAGINGKSYQPHIVSIGPYHRGKPHVAMIQEHKWRYLGSLLNRIPTLTLESLLSSIAPLEPEIRASYSEQIDLDRDEFLESMVLDGCFIVELFRKVAGVVEFEQHDPIVAMSWIMPFFYRDFLRLENQIPFFLLESLFHSTLVEKQSRKTESGAVAYNRKGSSNSQNPHFSRKRYETKINIRHSQNSNNFEGVDEHSAPPLTLSALALYFFNHSMLRSDEIIYKYRDLKGKHLLDLIRSSYTQFEAPVPRSADAPPVHIIHSITKLRKAGIKLRRVEPAAGDDDDSPLQVRFRRGVLEMPGITIDDFMGSFLINVVAYEQCYSGGGGGAWGKHFTAYATLLDSLVNGFRDVEYLCDKDILENYWGTEAEVARFLNDLGKEVAFDIDECYLAEVFGDVHRYYGNSWHVQWASFKFTYFQTPWSFISALAAFALLVLTVLQTVYTIYSVYN